VRFGLTTILCGPISLGDPKIERVIVGQQFVGPLVLAGGADIVEGELELLALGVEIAGALVELGLLERQTAAGLGLVDVAVGLADLPTMLAGIGDADEVVEVADRVAA